MIIVDELSFSFVEREGFREFVDSICPNVKIPSRFTVARDIVDFYMEEKKKLKGFFIKSKPRVSFTTDTWTTNQRISYMCLTAHFIDNEWNYHKRLINFKPILSHRGVNIATEIDKCLYEWGIENVMVFTMDNASSNDVAVRELSNRLPNLLSKGKYLHVRCIARIINLIVQDGSKASIDCIRNAVKYVRQSPSRLATFKTCAKEKSIDSKALLSLDVCTRWNSTCEMLEKAIVYEKAFDAYAVKDPNFRKDLDDIPGRFYWSYAKQIVALLLIFKHKTEQVSCSNYVIAREVFSQIVDNSERLEKKHKESSDLGHSDFRTMVALMQDKFDKYFEDTEKKNMLFQFANILDPRYKLELVVFESEKIVDLMKASRPEMTEDEYQDYVDTMVEYMKKEMEFIG